MFTYLANRPFWVHLLTAAILAILLVFGTLQMLSSITRHGEHLTVPAVIGVATTDAVKQLEDQGFDVVIQDSIFTDTLARGIVIKQLPDPNATVKINRTVYLTVNRVVPPLIIMPDLVNKSLSFALDILKRSHLELGDTTYKPDFMKGSIMQQLYKGEKIRPGTKLQWGSSISLVISGGLQEINVSVPDIIGMRYVDAKPLLDSLGVMLLPVVDRDVKDTLNAFIYKQSPDHLDDKGNISAIKSGMMMDVWLSVERRNIQDTTIQ